MSEAKDDCTNELHAFSYFKTCEDAHFSFTEHLCVRLLCVCIGWCICVREHISFGLLVKDDNSDYNNNRSKYRTEKGEKREQEKPGFSEQHNLLNICITMQHSEMMGAILIQQSCAVAGLTYSLLPAESHVYLKHVSKESKRKQISTSKCLWQRERKSFAGNS